METVIGNNPGYKSALIGNINKLNLFEPEKISVVKEKVIFITKKEIADSSGELVKEFLEYKESLPEDKFPSITLVKSSMKESIKILHILDDFLNSISSFEIDESHAKEIVKNFKEAKKITQFIVEYFDLIIKVHYAKKNIKSSNKVYTYNELKSLLN